MNVAAINLGCPKNCVDLEQLLGSICCDDLHIVDDVEKAEVVIINTCAFIQPAIQESLETIFEVSTLKQKNLKKLIVTGCLPQRFGTELAEQLPEADFFITTRNISHACEELVSMLGVNPPNRQNCIHKLTPPHYAYVKIADGCNNNCAYCTIPSIKGNYKSCTSQEIISRAGLLLERGVKELILVAQDTTLFGSDVSHEQTLPELVAKLALLRDDFWLRLLYAHPAHLTDQLLTVMAEHDTICKYIDLPIQHASNKLLSLMGRKITTEKLLQRIESVRRFMPDSAIRSTVIVGFPGETEQDVEMLLDFLEEVQFDRLGVFTYCREEGTRAYNFKDQVSEHEKNDRQAAVLDLQNNIITNKNKELIGRELSVLVDRYDDNRQCYYGRTEWDCPEIDNEVVLHGRAEVGEFVYAQVTGVEGYDLVAEAIKRSIDSNQSHCSSVKEKIIV